MKIPCQHLIRQWEDWAATTYVDEWVGPARNDWGEELHPEGPGKGKGKAKAKDKAGEGKK